MPDPLLAAHIDRIRADKVRAAMMRINPAVKDAAKQVGWPAAVDAVATLLVSLLIGMRGPDGAKEALSRLPSDVDRTNREMMAALTAENSPLRAQG